MSHSHPRGADDYESSGEEDGVCDRILRFGKYAGQTVSKVCKSKEGRSWLRWAIVNLTKLSPATVRAMNDQLEAYELIKRSRT